MCPFLLGAREAPNVLPSGTSPDALYLSLLWGKRGQYVQSASMAKKEYMSQERERGFHSSTMKEAGTKVKA
ncbi:hypothetical protein AMTRI_Chr09g38980 [Amborella trichopoda]